MGSQKRGRVAGESWRVFAVLCVLVLTTACGASDVTDATGPTHSARRSDRTTAATGQPTTTQPSSTTAPPAACRPHRHDDRAPATTAVAAPLPATSSPSPSLADRLIGADTAGQVIAVVADGYGQTTATLTAYQRVAGGWQQAFGPWEAHIGYNGFAPPGEKREGDGRTPSGSYAFDFFFGVQGDPGVRFPYRVVTSNAIVWDDDPTSVLYNEWVDTNTQDPGAAPEPMYNVPAYSYGAVISYNVAGTPGLGSAIFLHVSTGGSTAGCVSLPMSQLVQVLQWLDPSQEPRIVMGTLAAVMS